MAGLRRLVAWAASVALIAGMSVVGTAPADARSSPRDGATVTYKACANKDSGAIRLVVKGKRCKKNELKLSWNVQGPAGLQGPIGPQGPAGVPGEPGRPRVTVLDGSGAEVPGVVSVVTTIVTRLVDGGLWLYELSGSLLSGEPLVFKDDQCAGAAYVQGDRSAMAGTQARIVGGRAGRPAFRYSAVTETATGTWYANYGEECSAFVAMDSVVTQLIPVPTPPALIGPLTVVLG